MAVGAFGVREEGDHEVHEGFRAAAELEVGLLHLAPQHVEQLGAHFQHHLRRHTGAPTETRAERQTLGIGKKREGSL